MGFSFVFLRKLKYRIFVTHYCTENICTRKRNMKCFTLLSVILIPVALSQDIVQFGDDDQTNADESDGNTNDDPEVATRLICPQDLLNPGGNSGHNNGRYCDRCYCSDWDCRRDCRKCGNYGASGWSSSSGNNNWGQSSSNHVNCNSCYCSSSSCRNTCRKCVSNSNNGHYNNNNSGH